MELEPIEKAVGIITGSSAGFWALWTKIIKPVVKRTKNKREEVFTMIQAIHSELRFNGGGSIKDAIWGLKETNKIIIDRIDAMEEAQKISMNLQGQAFWLSNKQGEMTYASPALCKILGHNESDLIGNNWVSWVDEKDRVFDAWNFSVDNQTVFDELYCIKRGDGKQQKVMALCFHRIVNNTYDGSIGKIEPVGEPF